MVLPFGNSEKPVFHMRGGYRIPVLRYVEMSFEVRYNAERTVPPESLFLRCGDHSFGSVPGGIRHLSDDFFFCDDDNIFIRKNAAKSFQFLKHLPGYISNIIMSPQFWIGSSESLLSHGNSITLGITGA
jgi:hypothetical protein